MSSLLLVFIFHSPSASTVFVSFLSFGMSTFARSLLFPLTFTDPPVFLESGLEAVLPFSSFVSTTISVFLTWYNFIV